MITVLIIDDHDIVREGVKQIVSETSDIHVRGEARTAAEALEKLRAASYDVVVLDLNLPDRPGLDLLTQIRSMYPRTPVLVLTMHREVSYATRVFRAGAAGFVGKDTAREHLPTAIRRVTRGERFIAPALAEHLAFDLMNPGGGKRHEQLSDREFQVLCMIASGKAPRQIAAELGVSVKTVGTHRARLLQKMGLKNNAELVQYAIENRLI
ncbi:MAG: response regulator [Thermoanaerobaculia bacterium]